MFAVIEVPQFSLQAALRHEPALWSKPVALVDPSERPPVVCDLTEPARVAGITPGLTPTQAMARCGTVLIRPRTLQQEDAVMTAILQCAYAFSPHVEATAPGVCTLDLEGLVILGNSVKGEPMPVGAASRPWPRDVLELWAQKLQQTLAQGQLTVRIGIGSAPGVARHAARWGAQGVHIVENPTTFIAGLPVTALEPSSATALILKRWGIRTVGELLDLGQDALTARLGLEALALLAAASSNHLRPLRLVRPPETFEESFEFETEVETLEPLLFLLRRFVDQLTVRLKLRGWVAESLILQLDLESGQKLVSRLRLPQPSAQPDILFRTLHTHLETLRSESAIQSVCLRLLPCQGEQKQLGLFETILSDPDQFRETLARLMAVLGADRVGTPALENSHHPDVFRMVTPDFENAPPADSPPRSPYSIPIRRFRPPLKAEVECDLAPTASVGIDRRPRTDVPIPSDSQASPSCARPISIKCAVSKGQLKILLGPWRASGHWWEQAAWDREEWDALTREGQVIRLVHQPEGWFVEGVVD